MDEQEELNPSQSKCWSCVHGYALADQDVQQFFQPVTVEGNSFESQSEQQGLNEISFEIKKIRSVCFWKPNNQTGPPLLFALVKECVKYAKNH